MGTPETQEDQLKTETSFLVSSYHDILPTYKYITTFASAKGKEHFFINIQVCAQVDQANVDFLVTTFRGLGQRSFLFGIGVES